MHLIIGGAYQGKLEYAKEKFNLSDEDVLACTESGEIAPGSRCVYRLELYVLSCVRRGVDPCGAFSDVRAWSGCVIICEDIFCGVVPLDPTAREWREATGRLLNKLSPEADSVTRLFCGIPQKLK